MKTYGALRTVSKAVCDHGCCFDFTPKTIAAAHGRFSCGRAENARDRADHARKARARQAGKAECVQGVA